VRRFFAPFALALLLIVPGQSRAWNSLGVPVCTQPGNQVSPIAFGMGDGGMVVLWADQRGSDSDLYMQRLDGNGAIHFAFPANGKPLCVAPGEQGGLSAIEVPGGFAMSWVSGDDIYALRVGWDGNPVYPWLANGVPVSTAPGWEGSSQIVDRDGGLFVVWSGAPGFVYSRRIAQGLDVMPGGADTRLPLIVGDLVGIAIDPVDINAIFVLYRYGGLHVMRAVATWDGFLPDPSWPAGGVVLSISPPDWPRIRTNATGGASVSWLESNGVHVQRILANGSIPGGWPAGGRILAHEPTSLPEELQLESDGEGNALVAWTEKRTFDSLRKLRIAKVAANGMIASGWPDPGQLIREGVFSRLDPVLSIQCGNTPLLGWSEGQLVGAFDAKLRVQRVSPYDGSIEWASGGVPLTTAPGYQDLPAIARTSNCDAVVAWVDNRLDPDAYDFDVYGAKLTAEGDVVAVGGNVPLASAFAVRLAGANPTRGPVSCALTLGTAQRITADVLDVAGRQVRVLAEGESRGAGTSRLEWDGRAADGRAVASGLYVVRVRSGAAMTQARFIVTR
jgi:hypothetical protein